MSHILHYRFSSKTATLLTGLLMASGLIFSGCSQQASTEDTPEKTQVTETAAQTTYLVSTISSFPPFVMRDEFGKAQGFDMDILNAIGEKEGFAVKFLIQPWAEVLPSIAEGTRDIAATGIVITPERQALYDFSDPYLDTGWMMLMKQKEGEEKYTSFAQVLDNPKLVFTTEKGAAGVPELENLLAGKPNEIKASDTQYLEIKSVLAGDVDVAFDIDRVLQYYAHSNSDKGLYGFTDPNAQKDNFGFVVKKGRSDDLLAKINSGLAKIKADGTYQTIYEKWYGAAE